MATSITTGETKATVPARGKAAAEVQVSAPSRREFLYYIWGASIALLLGEASAGLIWFALPRFKEGTFGGVFNLDPEKVPEVNTAPLNIAEGRFWVSHPEAGLVVLFGVCTHLGCLPKWSETNFRFECPCHGSKYQIDGHYIEGPAPRSLDRFLTTLTFDDGTTAVMDSTGDPIPLDGRGNITRVAINTGVRIKRAGRV
ncbi:MAG: ubiquinol-cytochrome c reductase iron-sulfur subunit [Chloroflexota bacterium]